MNKVLIDIHDFNWLLKAKVIKDKDINQKSGDKYHFLSRVILDDFISSHF